MWHNSAAQPFSHDGGSVGVLLCHGFTSTPASLRPWAEFLARHGYSVRLPLLPGHGTTWQEMNRTTWTRWLEVELDAYAELRKQCDKVFIAGLSMGGTLALRIAEQVQGVDGIILVNASVHTDDVRAPFAKLLQYVLPSLPGIGNDIKKPGMNEYCYDRLPVKAFVQLQDLWKHVSADIDRVTQPVLMFRSVDDHVVEPSNAAWIAERVASTDKTVVTLHNSYHVATLDYDAEEIFQTSLNFIQRLS